MLRIFPYVTPKCRCYSQFVVSLELEVASYRPIGTLRDWVTILPLNGIKMHPVYPIAAHSESRRPGGRCKIVKG